MLALVLFALLFVGGHFILSALPVRDRLVRALGGERVFVPLYATVAVIGLVGMAWAYRRAPTIPLWQGPHTLAWVPVATMPVAFWLLVESLTRRNPAAVFQAERPPQSMRPQGLFAVTRHPGLWAFALWAAAHLVVNGDLASVVLMGSVLVLALGGMAHIDARRRARLGGGWDAYADHTSALPFAAIIAGRARLRASDLGWWRPAVALAATAAVLHLHPLLFGVSPLP